MSFLSSPNRSLSRRTTRLPIAVSVLAVLVVLPRAHAFTAPTPAATPGQPLVAVAAPTPLPAPGAGKATIVAFSASTCRVTIQRLSGNLAATPSTADKPGTVMIDVDKADVMMTRSHSDSITTPAPDGEPR